MHGLMRDMNSEQRSENGGIREEEEERSSALVESFHQRVLTLANSMNLSFEMTLDQNGSSLLRLPPHPNSMIPSHQGYELLLSAPTEETLDVPLLAAAPGNSLSLSEVRHDQHGQEDDRVERTVEGSMIPWVSSIQQAVVNTSKRTSTKWLAVGLPVVLFASVVCVAQKLSPQGDCPRNERRHASPALQRLDRILACISDLPLPVKDETSDDSAQSKAVLWLFNGQGKDFAVEEHCDSSFATTYALAVLRETLAVPDVSWYTSPHVCHWTRIICDEHEQLVTGVSLNNANLTGTLPVEVSLLTTLSSLEIFSNSYVTGTIPTEVGLLTNLQHLKLHQTALHGTIPTELGRLTHLEELLMHNTELSGNVPKQVCNLPSLTSLHVDATKVSCACCHKND